MARKTREEKFAPLEDENIRSQIPKKILPLIEQLVFEQTIETNAALTLRLKLMELRVEELESERRMAAWPPAKAANPWHYYDPDAELDDEELTEVNCGELDEERDDEIPF